MAIRDWFTKKRPDRSANDEPMSPIFVIGGQSVRFLSQSAVSTAEAAQRKSPQLYRITNFIASAVQLVPWYCEVDKSADTTPDRVNASKIRAINDLLTSPNDGFTSQQLRYWLALNLMLYARAHFKVGVGVGGNPNGIYPLAAKYVTGELNSRGTVERYVYGNTSDNKTTLPTRRTAGAGQAYGAEISFPSLTGIVEYNKMPPAIESIMKPVAIIEALMQRALDTASGQPNVRYVITAEKTLTRQQQDALRKYMEESTPGEENSGEVLFLYNTAIQVHPLDNKLSDIHSKIPLDDMTRQIAGVFGVPIALVGLGSADAAKFSNNYAESRLAFWQDTIGPCYLSPIAAGMTQAICPPGAKISFDLDAIPALWDGRASLGQKLTKVGFLTNNEKRDVLGYEKIEGGDVLVPLPVGGDDIIPGSGDGDLTPANDDEERKAAGGRLQ